MPIAESTTPPARQALLVGLGAIGALATIVLLMVQLGGVGGDRVPVSSGTSAFVLGEAAELADSIAADGPLLLPDASGGQRDIWVQHIGDAPDEGWLAFAVRPLEAPRDCFADWQADQQAFVDTCDGTTYPPDGDGLKQYPISVTADGNIELNLGLG